MGEAAECLAKLMEAHKAAEEAARILRGAPDTDALSKSAIETEVGQISTHLEATLRQLDAIPQRP